MKIMGNLPKTLSFALISTLCSRLYCFDAVVTTKCQTNHRCAPSAVGGFIQCRRMAPNVFWSSLVALLWLCARLRHLCLLRFYWTTMDNQRIGALAPLSGQRRGLENSSKKLSRTIIYTCSYKYPQVCSKYSSRYIILAASVFCSNLASQKHWLSWILSN